MSTRPSVRNQHAIVMGGSMAGLLTARVLSDHFARVTLLERDPVEDAPMPRKGQPQTRHLHGLLATGLQMMTRFFPDLPDALVANGALVSDLAEGMCWYTYGGYRRPFHFGASAALMSRPLLESLIRRRVLALSNVTLLDECDVERLLTSDDGRRVLGVQVTQRGESDATRAMDADLVVDCTGRGSRMPKWLTDMGFAAPVETEITVNVGYATRLFRRDPADPHSRSWFLVTPEAPRETRFGGMFPIEGDRWIVSVGGWEGDHAPIDEQGFMEYVRTLPGPDIYRIVSKAEPLSDIVPHRFKSSLRRHYEKLAHFPDGLLVLGDAVCSFNPTYGQGMTSAALQASELDALLSARGAVSTGLARSFFKAAAKIIDIPWQLAVGEDFRFPGTTGPKPAGVDLINAYVGRVHRATLTDPVVGAAFIKVMNLLAPPTSLFKPSLVWRVVRATRASRARAAIAAAPVEAGAD